MRSFLIRDILSGSAAAAAAAAAGAGPQVPNSSAAAAAETMAAGSSFDAYAAAQSLAVSQARFLAKLAEHQQQVQAGKYYEQLQQHHADQLLSFSQHQHQLQQLQQLQQLHHHHQQQQHQHQHQHQLHPQQQLQSPSSVLGAPASLQVTPGASSLSSQASHSSGTTTSAGGQLKGPVKRQKVSSFTYDCSSPITSISDCAGDDDEEAGECSENDEDDEVRTGGRARAQLATGTGRRPSRAERDEDNDDEDADELDGEGDDEDDEVDIEVVERAGLQRASSRAASSSRSEFATSNQTTLNHCNNNNNQRLMSAADRQQMAAVQFQQQLNSPLDALFQMTSNTFDTLKRGDKRPRDRESDQHGSTNLSNKQTSKKKRKSRTAFTNNQIYELERRFRMQKYLSPTDRDEIAMTLHLSNAQVITWFQNRRAKLKRDLEEQKRDIETASLMNLHKTFLESFQVLSQMKSAIKPDTSMCRLDTNNQTTTNSAANTTTANTPLNHLNNINLNNNNNEQQEGTQRTSL